MLKVVVVLAFLAAELWWNQFPQGPADHSLIEMNHA